MALELNELRRLLLNEETKLFHFCKPLLIKIIASLNFFLLPFEQFARGKTLSHSTLGFLNINFFKVKLPNRLCGIPG